MDNYQKPFWVIEAKHKDYKLSDPICMILKKRQSEFLVTEVGNCVAIVWVYKYVKMYHDIYLRFAYVTICKLYLNKKDFFKMD